MEQLTSPQSPNKNGIMSPKELLDRYLRYKWWIVASALVFTALAYVYARYSKPIFESKASVLIQEDKGMSGVPELTMLKDLGMINGGGSLEDEIEKFKSRTLMERVVRDLHLNWSYENIGTKTGIVRSEFFDNCPIEVRYLDADSLLDEQKMRIVLTLEGKDYYTISQGHKIGKYRFGSVLHTAVGRIVVAKTSSYTKNIGKVLGIKLDPFREVVEGYQKVFTVEAANKESNIIVLKLKGPNPNKNNAILDRIISAHQEKAILDKNSIVEHTTLFINERMKFIAVELSDVEKEGEAFKTQHNLVDVTTDAAQYMGKESELEKQVIETTIEKNLVDFMLDFMKEQKGYDQMLPANMGFKDESIVEMTTSYNELIVERNRIIETNGAKNPAVARVESQLGSLRSSLVASLKNLRSTIGMQLKKLSNEEAVYQSKIATIPQYERAYRDILRQQQIKETLYLFLLQKREENQISLAATASNTQIVDKAFSSELPVAPKKKIILLIGLLVGILIPIGIIYIREIFNTKLKSRKDLEEHQLDILVELPQIKKSEEIFILNKPNSSISEAFRVLRSNLSFVLSNTDSDTGKVISITSTGGGEGKTFTSVNLAFMYAASGKKVVLVGLDLRKPRLREALEMMSTKKGVSNYLVNNDLNVEDLIEPCLRNQQQVDVLFSGDIPPNPSELLLSNRLDVLIAELKQKYDYVILDNAPVGLVVDALSVDRVADSTLYIVRANVLDKRQLTRVVSLKNENKLKNMYVVLNGLSEASSGYYGYGYGESNKKNLFQRLGLKK